MANTARFVVLNEDNLRRIKIKIDGADASGKNTSRGVTVLAKNVESVYDAIIFALTNARGATAPPKEGK